MSKPENPLAAYRSSSYYHVLIMCADADVAQALATNPAYTVNNGSPVWQHPSYAEIQAAGPLGPFLGKYAPKTLPAGNGVGTQGKYCVIINGATDADFIITEFKFSAINGGYVVQSDSGTSIAIEGSFKVSEPRGVTFMDTIVLCAKALNIDPSTAVLMIKTFFIGYVDELSPTQRDTTQAPSGGIAPTTAGVTQEKGTMFIGNIVPTFGTLISLDAEYNENGAVYTCEYVPLSFGSTRMPQYCRVADGFSFPISKTIGISLRDLAVNINIRYDRYFSCAFSQILRDNPSKASLLTPVTYAIFWDSYYDDKATTNQDPQYANTATCNPQTGTAQQPVGYTIEDAIHTIMKRSVQVQKEATEGVGGQRYQYRIFTTLQSITNTSPSSSVSPTATAKTRSFIVYYFVRRIPVVTNVTLEEVMKAQTTTQTSTATPSDISSAQYIQQQAKKQCIEFDYIYSGKNIDVLEYSMKMNAGLTYFQLASMSNNLKDQLSVIPASSIVVDPTYDPFRKFDTKAFDKANQAASTSQKDPGVQVPVFFGAKLRGLENTTNILETASSHFTLNKYSSLESFDSKLKIVGNYNLLSSINNVACPANIIPTLEDIDTKAGATKSYSIKNTLVTGPVNIPHFEQRTGQQALTGPGSSFGSFPMLVKLNIFMPASNDDLSFFEGANKSNTPQYRKSFWYEGYYYVVGIENIFADGTFTQELDILPLPTPLPVGNGNQTKNMTNISTSSCFDLPANKPCVQTTVFPNNAPVNSDTPPTSFNDVTSLTCNKSILPIDPNNVKGYKKASPAVQQAISYAASKVGVDEGTLALIAYLESTFNPGVPSKTSGALGLFQFIPDTWKEVLCKHPIASSTIPQEKDGLTADQVLEQRTNPKWAALAGACFLQTNELAIQSTCPGDVYLAHFYGTEGAKRVIAFDNEGRGGDIMANIFPDTWAKTVKANPELLNPYPGVQTVSDFRQWAANKVYSGLTLTAPSTAQSAPQNPIVNNQTSTNSALNRQAIVHGTTSHGTVATTPTYPTAAQKLGQATNPCSQATVKNEKQQEPGCKNQAPTTPTQDPKAAPSQDPLHNQHV